jgi:hypothetical protein
VTLDKDSPVTKTISWRPAEETSSEMLFNVVAWFSHPIDGRERVASTESGMERVFAADPLTAAYELLSRLSGRQRGVVDRVIVWAPKSNRARLVYGGRTIVYRRRGNRLIEGAGFGGK